MLKTILVPLDGSTFGEHALPLALTIARRAGAKLQLIRVQPPLASIYAEFAPISTSETLADHIRAGVRAADQDYLKKLIHRLGDPAFVSAVTAEGEVADAIRAAAARAGADLVVMTTHGRGPLGRFWLGSVADELVRSLPMPVLLVPPKEEAPDLTLVPSLKHILLPLDGTKLAEQILEPVTTLAHLADTRFTLVRVVKPAYGWGYPADGGALGDLSAGLVESIHQQEKHQREQAERYLDQMVSRLWDDKTPIFTQVMVEEQPGPAILRVAQEVGADLIALETHGRRGLGRLILGSVADKVVRAASLPVLLHTPKHEGVGQSGTGSKN